MLPGPSKIWQGIKKGNYSGNLWQTFNIDLERQPGRICLSDKMIRFSTLGVARKWIRTNATGTDQWFALAHNDIFRSTNSAFVSGTWISDDVTGTFNDPIDGVVHEISDDGYQRLIVSRASNVAMLNHSANNSVWDDDWGTAVAGITAPTSAMTHRPVARLQRLVAIANKVLGVPRIDTVDKDDVVSNARLTFDAVYTVRCMYTSSSRFWIGLQNDLGGPGKIIEWDGFSLTYNNEYEIDGTTPMSGFVAEDIPYFVTEKGRILKFTGGGFEEVADFTNREERQNFDADQAVGGSVITAHGCFVEGNVVYMNVAAPINTVGATSAANQTRRLRSGIWVFNIKNYNLYHHMGMGEHASAGTDVNYGDSPLHLTGAVIRPGGERFLCASASVYTGGASWLTNTQVGMYRQSFNNVQTGNAGRNRGYFITPYIPIEGIEAMWKAVWIKFKRFANSNNRIILKWRTREPLFNASAQDPSTNELIVLTGFGTWASTTTFTCAVPVGVAVGDEVEILNGDNAGCSFNISALSGTPNNSSTITVTIDEAAPTSSTDTFLCRFDNWRTETAISATDLGSAQVPLTMPTTVPSAGNTHGEFIQLKVELRGFDVQVDELIPVFNTKTSAPQA